jgi:AraC-like DNA-binding protein
MRFIIKFVISTVCIVNLNRVYFLPVFKEITVEMIPDSLNVFMAMLNFGSLVLLSFLIIANPLQVNKNANYWFGFFLLLWSSFWLDEIAQITQWFDTIRRFSDLVLFMQFFTPIIFYLSIVFFTNPDFRFRIADLKYLILPFIYLILLMLKQTAETEQQYSFRLISMGLILTQVLMYAILSYMLIRRHQKNVLLFASNAIEIDLKWLEYIISSILLVSIVIIVYNVFFNPLSLNVYVNIFFFTIIYFLAYNSLKQKEIYPLNETQRKEIISIEEEQSIDLKRKLIPDSDLVKYKSKLSELMRIQQPYIDSELNLIKLAELINMTPHQLSYIINTGFNENFFRFVNNYRVGKAKELLLKEEMNKLSILGIAFESGFNSKTSFNNTFKKITGLTPSEFKKSGSTL